MENLILDIKISIAEKDQEIWWLFYQYFDDFKSYTKRYTSHYCQLFTKTIRLNQRTHYHYLNTDFISYDDSTQLWYQGGLIHRDDGPALICVNGDQHWYQHGTHHRDGGPAIIYANGDQTWYQHGQCHRDGEPAVIRAGEQHWYQHGHYKHCVIK